MELTTRRTCLGSLGVAAALTAVVAAIPAEAVTAAPDLGTAASFAVLAASTVTNTGPSMISGDLGVSPGTAVTGFGPGAVVGGTIHTADAVALQAQSDLTNAYNTAAGLPPSSNVTADLGGQRLVAGVYRGPTLSLTGALALDAAGDPNAVFVFQAASTLITASASSILLLGGASPCNVFWQVGSSATLGTHSTFVGSVMALTSVTAQTGATVRGRLLARNAAVTLDSNTVTRPGCAAVSTGVGPGTPAASASASSAPTGPTSSPTSSSTSSPTSPPTSAPPAGSGGPASETPTSPGTPGSTSGPASPPGPPVAGPGKTAISSSVVRPPAGAPGTPPRGLARTGAPIAGLGAGALLLVILGLMGVTAGSRPCARRVVE